MAQPGTGGWGDVPMAATAGGTAWQECQGKRGGQAARWPKTGWCLSFGPWCLKTPFFPLAVVLSDASVALHGVCQVQTS